MRSDPCEMFRALSVETRLKIFEILKSKGPLGVKKLAGLVGVTPAAVSQHLRILKQAGLVRNERKGYWIPYSIDEQALENCRSIINRVCTCEWHGHHRRSGCHGRDYESELESLLSYRKRIEKELKEVERRIKEVRKRSESR